MMSGLMGSMVSGMAMGTGSAIAHRAVDSFMGPRHVEYSSAPEAAPAPPMAAPVPAMAAAPQANGSCTEQAKAFAECMSQAGGDMGACQFYFESMQQCKTSFV